MNMICVLFDTLTNHRMQPWSWKIWSVSSKEETVYAARLNRLNRFGRLAVLETFSATENTTFTHIIVLIADESLCSFPFDRNKIGKGSWFFGQIRG